MKGILRNLATVLILLVFVILNWATSQDVRNITLDAQAIVFQDSLIILNNLDETAVLDARLTLVTSEAGSFSNYHMDGYNLAALSSDTLEMTDFRNDENVAYLNDIPATGFSLIFVMPADEETVVRFSTDL